MITIRGTDNKILISTQFMFNLKTYYAYYTLNFPLKMKHPVILWLICIEGRSYMYIKGNPILSRGIFCALLQTNSFKKAWKI